MPTSPHDALFKYIFSQPEHAAAQLRAVLPGDIATALDWSTLTLQPGTFVDEQLAGRETDLLFSVPTDGHNSLVYVLFEHQSSSDALMAFRLLRYLVRIWDALLQKQPELRRLPPIVPVVLHHGEAGWPPPTDFQSLLDTPIPLRQQLAEYIPQFRFVLDDLSQTDDATLRGRAITQLALAGLALLRYGRGSDNLLNEMRRFGDAFEKVAISRNGVEAYSALLHYAFRVGDVPTTDLREFSRAHGAQAQEAFMTTAQQLILEGKAEGKVEGRAEGKAELLIRQLTLRFGELPVVLIERVRTGSLSELDTWAERVLTANSAGEVLG
jgi:predicted transposase YdaD